MPHLKSDLAGIFFYVLVIVHLSNKHSQYITLSISHGMKIKPTVLTGHFVCKNPVKRSKCSLIFRTSDQLYGGQGFNSYLEWLKILSVFPSPVAKESSSTWTNIICLFCLSLDMMKELWLTLLLPGNRKLRKFNQVHRNKNCTASILILYMLDNRAPKETLSIVLGEQFPDFVNYILCGCTFQNASTYRSVKSLRKMILKVKPYFSGLPETIVKLKSEND